MNTTRILATMAFLAAATTAQAQTATQTITFQVDAINQIAFTGSPSLTINTATAGSAPTAATATGSWAITTNQSNAKITASINSAMPTGVTLTTELAAPSVGTSAGPVALGTTAVDVVTGLTKVAQSAMTVTYTLTAAITAGVVASQSRIVTYTITGGI